VVAGVYPKKSDAHDDWPIVLKTTEDGHPIVKDGLLLGDGLPTGFMKIKKHVIEKMQEAYPELRYLDGVTRRIAFDFFGCGVRNYDPVQKLGRWFGDDYGFCDLWQRIGGETWVLPNIDFEHVGTKPYKGNYHVYLMGLPKDNEREDAPIIKSMSIDGWMTQKELEWMQKMSKCMTSMVEIGCFKGRTTSLIASSCPGQVIAIDTWEGSLGEDNAVLSKAYEDDDIYAEFIKNVTGYPNISIMKMPSLVAAKEIAGADMVFIDGEHTYESIKADIEAWLPKAKRVIAGHDYQPGFPGVIKAVNEIFGKVQVEDTIWYASTEAVKPIVFVGGSIAPMSVETIEAAEGEVPA